MTRCRMTRYRSGVEAQAQAVELLQERKSSWTRQDLIQQIGWCLPAEARNIPAAQVPALLERLAEVTDRRGETVPDQGWAQNQLELTRVRNRWTRYDLIVIDLCEVVRNVE